LPFNADISHIKVLKPDGIIFSGGPASVINGGPLPSAEIFKLGIPILGICYGMQLMAQMNGGEVKKGKIKEYGREVIKINKNSKLFRGMSAKQTVWFSHGDYVAKTGLGFLTIASSANCKVSGMSDEKLNLYALQFHPEVAHTKSGDKIISNFLFNICKSGKDWQIPNLKETIIDSLKKDIGEGHVLIGISGGVDSLVAASLLYQAIGGRLHAVFVDTGLLRKNEVAEVLGSLKKLGFRNLIVADAQKVFLKKLAGKIDPEEKRKIIGHTFIEVFEKTIKKELKSYKIKFFAQGTIYPDRIESAEPTNAASKIKSHHNLTLPEKFNFKLIEPLRDLYKDEVRKLGALLDLPQELLDRHPFPGPGLAIRIVGDITSERLAILREADSIYLDELRKSGEYAKIWQAFAVLLTSKTVGVMGDERKYGYIISLRAVDSIDGMTADWHKMPFDLLERIPNRITREVDGVTRVLYDITQKPPATIEYE